jgi:hypothetical protein
MSVVKPQKSAPGKPFQRGKDSRRGKGPKKGAPNAGAPEKHVRLRKAACIEMAVDQTFEDLQQRNLDVDQRLKLVKDWDSDDQEKQHPTLIVKFVRE